MVDAYGMLGYAAAVSMIPSIFMLLFTCLRSRLRARKVGQKDDEETVHLDDPAGGVTVALIELRFSTQQLRWAITYTCCQLGFMVTSISVTPMLAWTVGANRWRELASTLGSATGFLAFVPLGVCLMLLGIFPNDNGPIMCVLVLQSFFVAFSFIWTLIGAFAPYTATRPTLLVHSILLSAILGFTLFLLAPAWSNRVRCGPHRQGYLSELIFPPAYNSSQRLARIWLATRFLLFATGLLFAGFALLRVYADFIDQYSVLNVRHPHFITDMTVGISCLAHAILFTPTVRQMVLRLLGRRERPKVSDKLAAQLSGFDDFYDTQGGSRCCHVGLLPTHAGREA